MPIPTVEFDDKGNVSNTEELFKDSQWTNRPKEYCLYPEFYENLQDRFVDALIPDDSVGFTTYDNKTFETKRIFGKVRFYQCRYIKRPDFISPLLVSDFGKDIEWNMPNKAVINS